MICQLLFPNCQRHLCGNASGQRIFERGNQYESWRHFFKKGANLKKTSFFIRKGHSNFGANCYVAIPRYDGFSDFVV